MTTSWTSLLNALADSTDLTRAETSDAMTEVLNGDADPIVLSALLMGLKIKGESDEEILGFADAMMEAREPVTVPESAIDIVGTGGSRHSRSKALNVSTMAAFVAAAAGATVAKHGNVSASSSSGSFNLLQALGVDTSGGAAEAEASLAEHRLAFLWARTFHPAMRHAGPVRSALGVPTVFNVLGPLVHPGQVRRLVLGTPSEKRAEQLARVLVSRNIARAWVVCGFDGLDELSTAGPSRVWDVSANGVKEITIHPEAVGIPLVSYENLPGGDGEANAQIFRRMMDDPASEQAATDIVVLNAAAGLVVADVATDLISAVESARTALDSGAVAELFTRITA